MLQQGQAAVDAAGTVLLEDCIYFNAGSGCVYTHNGIIEMDAAIMDRSELRGLRLRVEGEEPHPS